MPPRRLRKRTIVAVPTARNTRGRNAGQEEMATALAAANTSGTPTPVTQADATPVSTGAPAIALAPVPAQQASRRAARRWLPPRWTTTALGRSPRGAARQETVLDRVGPPVEPGDDNDGDVGNDGAM